VHADYSWYGINLVKWSMVEPAIGITAAAIATLRPLFANFLKFGQKRYTLDSESSQTLTGSYKERMSTSSRNSGHSYSAEFAEMMGLEKYGVTTHISAAKQPGWRERRRMAKRNSDAESMVQLKPVTSEIMGIQTTTVVTIEQS
jgi:hypothetical protein